MFAPSHNKSDAGASQQGSSSSKRRSKIMMKIIPFAREPAGPPSPTVPERRHHTFPRLRLQKDEPEPVETLASHFEGISITGATQTLSPPSSASSLRSNFSISGSAHGGMSSSATSPDLLRNELDTFHSNHSANSAVGRKESGKRCKSATSRESMKALFGHTNKPSSSSLSSSGLDAEADWERTLEEAANRASWQSSISHRPRSHHISHSRSGSQLTWPRISQPGHQREGLMLEHVFVDASDDGHASYTSSIYSPFVDANGSTSSLPMSVCSSSSFAPRPSLYYTPPPMHVQQEHQQRRRSGLANPSDSRVPSISISGPSFAATMAQGPSRPTDTGGSCARDETEGKRYDTLPRMTSRRRPSTTGSSVLGEPAAFGFKSVDPLQNARYVPASSGTSSVGRSAGIKRRPLMDPNPIVPKQVWEMGRRRSSGRLVGLPNTTSQTATGSTTTMPTIPQAHSRETSLADEEDEASLELVLETEGDQYLDAPEMTMHLGHLGPRGGAVDWSEDSTNEQLDAFPAGRSGSGFIPLRLSPSTSAASIWLRTESGESRRPSWDDLALLGHATREREGKDRAGPRFDLSMFSPPTPPSRTSSTVKKPPVPPRRFSRSTAVPDVPETVTSSSDTEDLEFDLPDDESHLPPHLRRRSTFTPVSPLNSVLPLASPPSPPQ
ncbi:hypothetical protein BCV70DRAFT_233404 [Testicularia cyperi]|uniref:Uncharacterized protein n=1 Tax=Testicularia cyperi TaxID=1882483 RepID=A0A317XIM6_9BASI|nr:hypothetical protein BCV70DRAFT_233404 [Testicularia cyperi]